MRNNNIISPLALPTGLDLASGKRAEKINNGVFGLGNGWAGNIAGGLGSSFFHALGSEATGIGLNNVADLGHAVGEYFDERLSPEIPADWSWNYITSPAGIGRGVGNLWGSIASIAAPTLAFGGPIGAGAKALTKLPKIGKYINPETAQTMLTGALTAPSEALMEKGNYIENATANGLDPEVARRQSDSVFLNNLGLLIASNAVQWGLLGKILKGKNWKTRLASAFAEPLIQGFEEGMQEGFQLKAEGKPYTYNPLEMMTNPKYEKQYQAMKEGILPTAVSSLLGFAGSSGYHSIFGDRNKNQNPPVNENPAVNESENISNDADVRDQNSFDSYKPNDGDIVNWAKNISGGANENTIKKVIAEAERQGVNPKLALALANAESNIGINAEESSAGAIGVMQLMPETAEGLGVDPYNEDKNIKGGIKYLKQMLNQFGDEKLATAAYNAGPSAVEKYGDIPPYGETQAYVSRIFGFL